MAIRSSSALVKVAIVAILALMLLVPLGLLHSLVGERISLRESAYTQVSRGWGGAQTLGGVLIAIPVTTTPIEGRAITRTWYVLPESLDVDAKITVQDERRSVGIYEVPVYVTTLGVSAQFDVARQMARLLRSEPGARIHLDSARVFFPVDDPRGLRDVKITEADWITGILEPANGAALQSLAAPVRVDAALDSGVRRLKFTMEIAGTRSFAMLPLARTVRARLSGNWPHPGFTRGFLPTEREVSAAGFDARWQIMDFNRPYGGAWFAEDIARETLYDTAFGIDLVQPADLYQRVERSVKYGGLFVALSFLTLFVWERLARRPVHPIQYGLIGLALSVFYLLLLALAEHLGFAVAYVAAAVALCGLLGAYLSAAFRSRRAGVGAAGLFGAIFALLYLLVTSESYSLLVGALALFGMVAAAMMLTRHLDWYVSESARQEAMP